MEPHFIWIRTSFGSALHLDPNTSLLIGKFFTRAIALSGLMGMKGAFFFLLYSPIKSFIMGSDPRLWPKAVTSFYQILTDMGNVAATAPYIFYRVSKKKHGLKDLD